MLYKSFAINLTVFNYVGFLIDRSVYISCFSITNIILIFKGINASCNMHFAKYQEGN